MYYLYGVIAATAVAYLLWREVISKGRADFAALRKKVRPLPIDRVPRTAGEETRLLSERPPAWEYLLFGSVLFRGKQELEHTWRDYELGYSVRSGPQLDLFGAIDRLDGVFNEAVAIVENFNRVLTEDSQTRAFGAPGEPGNPDLIEHLAIRLTDVYRELLAWASRLRSASVPEDLREAFRLASNLVGAAIREYREFVDRSVAELDALPARLRDGESVKLILDITLTVRDEDERAFSNALRELSRRYGA